MKAWLLLVALACAAACGDDSGGDATDGDGTPDAGDGRPTAPATNDPAFALSGLRRWYLIGNPATPGDNALALRIAAPAGVTTVDAWVGTLPVQRLPMVDGTFALDLDLTTLPAGTYEILLAADESPAAFARVEFSRSAPYYVLVATDWDFSDPGDACNALQDRFHAEHPGVRITHFVGPYTFTDPQVTAQRRETLVAWLLEKRDQFDDEIALHIHPWCHFVVDAGLTCITDQSTVYAEGDTTGYTIKVGAYDRAQMRTLLAHANTLFEANGLPRSRTFRAGGWTATIDTLGALADEGFVADTSALNWARIEEWEGRFNGELFRWNMENWSTIDDVSQPYYPNTADVLSSADPTLPLLEVPDNGVMVDYVDQAELAALFAANWDGGALAAPTTLMVGYHPASTFSLVEFNRVTSLLTLADSHLAIRDLGPVVYITLEDVVAAFPRGEDE